MTRIYILFAILLKSLICEGQILTGKWSGNLNGTFGYAKIEKLELDIKISGDSIITGKSHVQYPGGAFESYAVSGKFNPKDSSIFLSEDSLIDVKHSRFNKDCKGIYLMQLFGNNGLLWVEGRWKESSGPGDKIKCPSTRIYLEKQPEIPEPVKTDPNLLRKATIQQLEIGYEEKDSIKIELLDNAQIDHDVVSVYIDDSLVLSRQKLTAQPVAFYIALSRSKDKRVIKMAAESMGSIPPCTALMIVSTRKNRYHVTLSSDFGNNGLLQLSLKE
jgi:hypothetical protein